MHRRAFQQAVLATVGILTLGPRVPRRKQGSEPRVNGARLLEHLDGLSAFGRNPEGGVSRLAYSQADLDARQYVTRLMRAAHLETSVDVAGNLIGRRRGTRVDLQPVMFGSHIDSVPHGGNYDGPVGSLAAIECAHTLADHAITTRHPLEVVIFQNEEGGKTGSRALSGEVMPRELDLVTRSGHTIRDGIALLGGDPSRLPAARRAPNTVAAYLELHVEQGAVLDREGLDIGVVEGIVGIKRWRVVVEGSANHAGTTPMDSRADALLAAAQFIEAVHRTMRDTPGRQVGTVGQIEAHPGAPNVIPGHVTLSLELRDLRMRTIDAFYAKLYDDAARIGRETGTRFQFEQFYVSRAAPTDERISGIVADAATKLGHSLLHMPSGAGHDAQSVAQFAPVGMIFIPSVDGISHSPREFSRPEHVIAGADVLLRTLLAVDRRSWE